MGHNFQDFKILKFVLIYKSDVDHQDFKNRHSNFSMDLSFDCSFCKSYYHVKGWPFLADSTRDYQIPIGVAPNSDWDKIITLKRNKIRLFEAIHFFKPILKLKKLYYDKILLLNYYKRHDIYTYLSYIQTIF